MHNLRRGDDVGTSIDKRLNSRTYACMRVCRACVRACVCGCVCVCVCVCLPGRTERDRQRERERESSVCVCLCGCVCVKRGKEKEGGGGRKRREGRKNQKLDPGAFQLTFGSTDMHSRHVIRALVRDRHSFTLQQILQHSSSPKPTGPTAEQSPLRSSGR